MRFVKGVWKLLVGIKDGLVLLAMLLFFGLLFAALSWSPNPAATLPSGGALWVKLDGRIVEQPAEADPVSLISGSSPATREHRLSDVVRAIDAAAKESRVSAIVLDLDSFLGGGQAALGTVGDALDRARRAGKPILAYATGYSDDGYQLAAHATEVWTDPLGGVVVTGPGGAQLYYKGLLDKLGVTAKVYRVGTYKSAVEPYVRTDQSPEARAANQALVDALWQDWRDDVTKARPKARIDAAIAGEGAAGTSLADRSVALGLVDRLGDRIAFGKRVGEIAGAGNEPGTYRAIPLDHWIAANAVPSGGNIGVVTIAGPIVDGDAPPGTAGGDTIAGLILKELARNRIKALVVRVDSPGGSVTASERIRSALMEVRAKKIPVVVSMGSVAASGGYWVATAGERIFAEPATITGSIGVFGVIPTFQGSLDKLGLAADGVKTTPLSGEPDVLRGTSPEFDQLVQGGIETVYTRFIGLVGQARGMPPARVDSIGQGRVWAGGVARQIGLVDQFGGLDAAIAEAARRAKIDPADARPLMIERPPHPLKQLFADWFAGPEEEAAQMRGRDIWSMLARGPEASVARAVGDARMILSGPVVQVRCLECPADAVAAPRDKGLAALLVARLTAW